MTTELREGDFDAFFRTPFEIYGRDTPYVSPLKSDLKRYFDRTKNPLLWGSSALTFFTAHRDGKILGRITAHEHAESNEAFTQRLGYFGFFDCADDIGAATALLSAAEAWCRGRLLTSIAGNFNLTAMQQVGVMTDGFDKVPYTDQIWSPPHLPALLEANGYERTFPMATMESNLVDNASPALGPKQKAILDDPEYKFVGINRLNLRRRMEEARQILNAAFDKNPMFLPLTADEFAFQAQDMKWILDPRLSSMLHWRGEPAACVICIPDLNPLLRATRSEVGVATPLHYLRHRLNTKRAVLIFSGVMPDLQNRGIMPLLIRRVQMSALAAGYERCGNTWISDDNPASLAQVEKASAQRMHRLHLFHKAI